MELAGISTLIYSAQSFAGKILSRNALGAVEFPALQNTHGAAVTQDDRIGEYGARAHVTCGNGSLWIFGY